MYPLGKKFKFENKTQNFIVQMKIEKNVNRMT